MGGLASPAASEAQLTADCELLGLPAARGRSWALPRIGRRLGKLALDLSRGRRTF